MHLKSLLREFLDEPEHVSAPRYNFLPNFSHDAALPVITQKVPWSRNNDLEFTIKFQRRDDLQDFVNCYLEIEEETATYARLTIDGFSVKISSDDPLPAKFRSMIEEIAHETQGS